jgi:uncharacterized protein
MRNSRWLALLVFLCALSLRAESVDKVPAPTAYINDYANVFHSLPQSRMEDICKELHDKTRAQIFVVTINKLDDSSIEQFANDLFHKWKIGEKKTDRGALILLAVDDHKYRIEVGYGLEGILNDGKVGDIGRTMLPDLRAANYDAAATTSLRAVAKTIADDSHVTLDALQQAAPVPAPTSALAHPDNNQSIPTWLFWCIWFGIVGFVITMIIIARLRGWKSSSGTTSWSTDSSSDNISSSSSSSDSFSGGDGGDSGGGGASGSW